MQKKYCLLLFWILIISPLYNCDSQTHKDSGNRKKTNGDSIISETQDGIVDKPEVFICDYLGEQLPTEEPTLFAPGIISLPKIDEYDFEISSTGNEMLFTRSGKIYIMSKTDSGWMKPYTASFSGQYADGEASFSPDGKYIYFMSNKPLANAKSQFNTWISENVNDVWQTPISLRAPLFNKSIHAVTVAKSGNIYFSGIYKITYINEEYKNIENLKPNIEGGHPFIAPDESYLIFNRNINRNSDLYIIYLKMDGTWTQPIKLNNKINSSASEFNAFVTHDEKYLFFIRNWDVFWVDAGFIKELKPEELK